MKTIHRAAEIEGGEDMTFRIVVSTETKGRDKLVVKSDGWELDGYRKNPVVLFNHNPDDLVGRAPKIEVVGKRLIANVELAGQGTSPVVDTVRNLVKQKMLKGASAGFRVLEAPELIWKGDELEEIVIPRAELYEFSLTPIPALPDALMLARSFGASEAVIARLFRNAGATAEHSRIRAELDLLSRRRAGR